MKKLSLALLVSCIGFSGAAMAHGSHTADNGIPSQMMMSQSSVAMADMHDMKLTGNTDVDFITGILPHHEGAIVMSEVILPTLKDENIRELAVTIIKSQKKEVAFMKDWLVKNPVKNSDPIDMSASKEMMEKSMKVMHQMHIAEMTPDSDISFIKGMLPHHEGAIVMSEVIIPTLKDPQVKKLAQVIIESQKKEIVFMKKWLSENSI
jgi:uncharacterized protein (DUF305 family)